MKLADLIARLQDIQKEVGDGGRHKSISGGVQLMCYEDDATDGYEIVDVEPQRTGCACWIGAYIVIKKQAVNG